MTGAAARGGFNQAMVREVVSYRAGLKAPT
jgi:hypothetical protein